ncbi:hypothetical protein [Cellulomonas fimi]|uniref:Uncharacterized protein n=1 Tax=Cellulomonas fimi (strain ATCC 484 / DSM 20113 / JCM 1341 / CCUG 24087 / LMG 16345 / NBRC 15513 / NCIMB 8980 / NCTC 7547 / NRS-133) TaxID=590998 RepID=F4H666_CELFA|nr:hypothetical protein [Cellulomonas fimi]AEE44378.1 hypothetical protein Celf_0232 [Cellulomonas fimi ATCC 484]NNH08642.1 hypothetical protein [Cellulomonas fimi]VEH26238.1 Uncharacterised protein [Cellulomonas fimi]
MRDVTGHRDHAAAWAATTYRPQAGVWNARTEPPSTTGTVRADPFAALGHEASRHGTAPHAHERGPSHSLWPHADEVSVDDERRTAWRPHAATWRPTPSVPFPRPVPPSETDPTGWA